MRRRHDPALGQIDGWLVCWDGRSDITHQNRHRRFCNALECNLGCRTRGAAAVAASYCRSRDMDGCGEGAIVYAAHGCFIPCQSACADSGCRRKRSKFERLPLIGIWGAAQLAGTGICPRGILHCYWRGKSGSFAATLGLIIAFINSCLQKDQIANMTAFLQLSSYWTGSRLGLCFRDSSSPHTFAVLCSQSYG